MLLLLHVNIVLLFTSSNLLIIQSNANALHIRNPHLNSYSRRIGTASSNTNRVGNVKRKMNNHAFISSINSLRGGASMSTSASTSSADTDADADADDNSAGDSGGGVTSEDLQPQNNEELESNNTIENEKNNVSHDDYLQNNPILNVDNASNDNESSTDQITSNNDNTNEHPIPTEQEEEEDDEEQNDNNTSNTTTTQNNESKLSSLSNIQETIETKQNNVSNLRTQGKELHDDGDFQSAAIIFQKAASELDYIISFYHEHDTTSTSTTNGNHDQLQEQQEQQQLLHIDLFKINEERATCRLHEALCHLKNKDYAKSIISCTDVLMDGVQIVSLNENDNSDGDNEDEAGGNDDSQNYETNDKDHHQTVIVRISGSNENNDGDKSSSASASLELSPAVRARAYHRRAKARLALGDAAGALDDARSAAFLGDRNAVALYGKLMRESGSTATGIGSAFGSDMGSLGSFFSPSSSSSSPLQSLFSGNDSGMNSPSSFDFLSSMLSDQNRNGNSAASPFGSLGALGSLLNSSTDSMGGASNTGGMDSLAKSLLTSLTKRIEDESTQEMVCNYLNKVDASQISSLSSMAGVPLSSSVIDRIVGFSNGVTPTGISKAIRLVKRLMFVGNVLRKTFQVIGKYKHLIVILMLIAWMKSAILRPVIVKAKTAKATAETLSKAAMFFI